GGEFNVAYSDLLPTVADAVASGSLDAERLYRSIGGDERARLDLAFHPHAATLVASVLGARGPVLTPSGACASGTMAIGLAAESIAWGDVDLCITGGTDARVEPMVMEQYARLGVLCADSNDAPERASRPFDVSR